MADPMTAPRPSWKRSLLFSSVVFVAFFGTLEGALRVIGVKKPARPRLILRAIDSDIDLPFMRADPELLWAPKAGFQGDFMGRPVTINSLGLRGAEPRVPRPRRRILTLGDSITFGYGVGDDETYAAALGRALAPQDVEIVNGGVTGYTSHQVRKRLALLAPTLRPDVVTVCIGWNDRTRRVATDREYDRRLRVAARLEGLADHLYLYRALTRLYRDSGGGDSTPARDHPRVPIDEYRENLAAIVRTARDAGARPVFLALPHRTRFEGPPLDPAYPQALRESAAALGVPLLDVGALGDAAPPDGNERFFIDSLHLSAEGADEMARVLVPQLSAAGLL
jgi:lysophospholipase L1-like esterase